MTEQILTIVPAAPEVVPCPSERHYFRTVPGRRTRVCTLCGLRRPFNVNGQP